jgi:hypothetical protein
VRIVSRNYLVLLPEVMQEIDIPVGGQEPPQATLQVRIETVQRTGTLKITLLPESRESLVDGQPTIDILCTRRSHK